MAHPQHLAAMTRRPPPGFAIVCLLLGGAVTLVFFLVLLGTTAMAAPISGSTKFSGNLTYGQQCPLLTQHTASNFNTVASYQSAWGITVADGNLDTCIVIGGLNLGTPPPQDLDSDIDANDTALSASERDQLTFGIFRLGTAGNLTESWWPDAGLCLSITYGGTTTYSGTIGAMPTDNDSVGQLYATSSYGLAAAVVAVSYDDEQAGSPTLAGWSAARWSAIRAYHWSGFDSTTNPTNVSFSSCGPPPELTSYGFADSTWWDWDNDTWVDADENGRGPDHHFGDVCSSFIMISAQEWETEGAIDCATISDFATVLRTVGDESIAVCYPWYRNCPFLTDEWYAAGGTSAVVAYLAYGGGSYIASPTGRHSLVFRETLDDRVTVTAIAVEGNQCYRDTHVEVGIQTLYMTICAYHADTWIPLIGSATVFEGATQGFYKYTASDLTGTRITGVANFTFDIPVDFSRLVVNDATIPCKALLRVARAGHGVFLQYVGLQKRDPVVELADGCVRLAGRFSIDGTNVAGGEISESAVDRLNELNPAFVCGAGHQGVQLTTDQLEDDWDFHIYFMDPTFTDDMTKRCNSWAWPTIGTDFSADLANGTHCYTITVPSVGTMTVTEVVANATACEDVTFEEDDFIGYEDFEVTLPDPPLIRPEITLPGADTISDADGNLSWDDLFNSALEDIQKCRAAISGLVQEITASDGTTTDVTWWNPVTWFNYVTDSGLDAVKWTLRGISDITSWGICSVYGFLVPQSDTITLAIASVGSGKCTTDLEDSILCSEYNLSTFFIKPLGQLTSGIYDTVQDASKSVPWLIYPPCKGPLIPLSTGWDAVVEDARDHIGTDIDAGQLDGHYFSMCVVQGEPTLFRRIADFMRPYISAVVILLSVIFVSRIVMAVITLLGSVPMTRDEGEARVERHKVFKRARKRRRAARKKRK